jgi:serine protease Do
MNLLGLIQFIMVNFRQIQIYLFIQEKISMNPKSFRPLFGFIIFVLAVSLACGPTPQATEAPPQEAASQATNTPAPVVEAEPTATAEPDEPASMAANTLKDAELAVIQIEAQGSFVDPEFGFVFNAAGRGSGFIIDPSGIAVTNNHVVTGAALLKVWVGGDTSKVYNAKVLGVSECSDLAVIDIEGDGFPYLEWYTGPVNVGLEIYAAGFPLGRPEFRLTKGIVSKERTSGESSWASVDAVIEHDATINPGNSGGPLITKEGKVVGINYAGTGQTLQYFAIGQDVAVSLVNTLRAGKDVDSIGVNGQAVVSTDGNLSGIWVSSVKSGSPADKAGVQGGDIITLMEGLVLAVDGTMSQYCDILRTHNPGDTLSIEVLRWLTGEYLSGQLNGRILNVASVFSNELGGEVEDSSTGAYSQYVMYTDDTGQIQLEVPAAWDEVDGGIWEADWGTFSFTSPAISASSDLDAYYTSYNKSGVFFAASRRLGDIGGYIQLLDGVRSWHEDNCRLDGRYDYGSGDFEDPLYQGKFDLWVDCGPNKTMVLMLAARPKANPTAYLLLLEMKIIDDADLEALDRILKSFQANF